jgi:hypothetical protein
MGGPVGIVASPLAARAGASFESGVLGRQGFLIGEEAIAGFSPTIAGTFGRQVD